jgi:hypothetical protein
MGNLRKITIVVILCVFIFGAVLSSSLVSCQNEDGKMDVTKNSPFPKGGIPAIDVSATVRTETATFALG